MALNNLNGFGSILGDVEFLSFYQLHMVKEFVYRKKNKEIL